MTATTQDRQTAFKDGELMPVPVAAGEVLPAGTLVCVDSEGLAVKGATALGLIALGMADDRADNFDGDDGDVQVLVRRGKAFQWANDPTDPVTQASFGRDCFIVDNQTVAASDGSGTRSPAGTVLGVDYDGVWVQ